MENTEIITIILKLANMGISTSLDPARKIRESKKVTNIQIPKKLRISFP